MILFVPRWHIRLRPEISIAPYPLLSSQVLSISSLSLSFLPRSSYSKFFAEDLSSAFHYPVSTLRQFVLCYFGLSWLHTQPTSISVALLSWWCPAVLFFDTVPCLWSSGASISYISSSGKKCGKPDSLWLSLWVTLQHSAPYSSTDKTLLW